MPNTYGPYEILERVAQGSTSTVYRARHVELDRTVAIKELSVDIAGAPGMRDRLRAEAEILARLESPHVVSVYDYVEEEDRAWIAEEWVDGAALDRILEVHGTLTPEQAVGVVRGAVLGLAHAHDHGLLHRDVSPNNVLADMEGTSKLVDFGLAAPVGEAGFSGTPAYMSPEATHGEGLTKASDVYSTAAVLYTLLAGRPPFAGSDLMTTVRRQAEDEVPVLDGHGHDLQDLLRRAMAKSPGERPQDARAFLGELEEAARRRFGAAWLQRASIAGLVAAATPVVAGGVASGGSVAAPTVVVDAASIVSPKVPRAARSGASKLAIGAVAAVAIIAATVATVAATGDEPEPDATPPTVSDSLEPVVDEPPEPTPEELAPTGRFHFARTLVSSTYDPELPKKETRTWTLDLSNCKGTLCKGSIESSSGSSFTYTWNGKKFDVTPPKGGRAVYKGPCVDDVTGEDVPGSLGRVVEVVTWLPLKTVDVDADGIPRRMEGGQRVMTTYEGLSEGCRDLPADRARYRVSLVRR